MICVMVKLFGETIKMIQKGLHKGFELYAPPAFWALSPEERENYTNGCGPGRLGFLVPETVYGCRITAA